MTRSLKFVSVAAALLAVTGVATAASHGNHAKPHDTAPPASSNRQSLDDADRGLDRSTERQSDSARTHSQAPGKKTTHEPNHGMDHRNPDHSMESHGKGWKGDAQ
jgi:hypothetical protein